MDSYLFRGGLVVDGTGAPAYEADVLTGGGRIASLGSDLTRAGGTTAIECGGLIVCPGFIDTHSHSDLRILVDPDLPMKALQGITLDVLGQDGISVAPISTSGLGQSRKQLAGLLGDPALEWSWRDVGQYLDLLDRGAAISTAYLVPHGAVRSLAMGLDDRAPTAQELAAMVSLVGTAMDQGAIGLSTGLIYPPCCYAAIDELVALCTEVARRGGVFVVHMRSESDRVLFAVDEMLEVARRSGVHLHISHIKIAGRANWPVAEAMIQKIEASGLDVTADQYPYTAGSTMFGAVLPPFAHAGGVEATLSRLRSAEDRARMRAAMQHPGPNEWDSFWAWTGPEGIVISDVPSGKRPELVGKTVAEGAALVGADPIDFAFDLLASEGMAVSMISHSQTEDVVRRFMQRPWVNGCTDGLLGGRPHPRAFGAFPRYLGRYMESRLGNDETTLPSGRPGLGLEEMIRKLTSQAATAMRLRDRGQIAFGLVADVVVFDPKVVMDRATFADPMQLSVGIEHVMVNGVPVVTRGKPTGARPGRSVRHKRGSSGA